MHIQERRLGGRRLSLETSQLKIYNMMKIPTLLLKLSLILLIQVSVDASKRPNILFIFTDDHAPHAIGAYNGWLKSINPTPVIDKLAKEGMVFVNSFCTNSICGPSRAVIQTGKHSHKNGFMNNGNTFDWNQQTFPKLLQKAGYQTAIYGKSHLKVTHSVMTTGQFFPGRACIIIRT